MKVIFNDDMRAALARSPIESAYRGTRRLDRMKLRRAGRLLHVSTDARSGKVDKKAAQIPAWARPQDIDVACTRIDLSRVAEGKYSSVAFHSLWRIASASDGAGPGICAMVSFMDATIVREVARKWIEFEPSCSLAFFRGKPRSYFGDIGATIGANLILELDSVEWDGGFAAFASELTGKVIGKTVKR
jgi:hypothetical protein